MADSEKKVLNSVPLSNWILIEHAEEQTSDDGEIIVSEVSKRGQLKGRVAAVGPGRYSPITGKLIPMVLKVGDTCYFNPFVPDQIKVDGIQYLICREDDIQLVFSTAKNE